MLLQGKVVGESVIEFELSDVNGTFLDDDVLYITGAIPIVYSTIQTVTENANVLEENNKLLRAEAERNHKLMRQMATLLKRVADEGDLIGEECQKFLDDFAAEIPF